MHSLLDAFPTGQIVTFDQCMKGCVAQKRTDIAGCLEGLGSFGVLCKHGYKHESFSGVNPDGSFRTKQLETYPSQMCHDLALLYVRAFLHLRVSAQAEHPFLPFHNVPVKPYFGAGSLLPSGRHKAGSSCLADVWPQRAAGQLLADVAAACHRREIPPNDIREHWPTL
jgi:hypothetical protein